MTGQSWDERVRRLLLLSDKTNREISDGSGVTYSTVNYFMRGDVHVRSDHFEKLARFAGFRLTERE